MQGNLIEVRAVHKAVEAVDICSLELESVSGEPLPPFDAGAHIDLHFGGFIRQGMSGTCLTHVLSGVPDHRDMFLTQASRPTAQA